jgi:anaerobic dimethyl sulfoxide reductase subunit A
MEELEPPAFWIHPADACERGIKNGELMEVFNDRGCVRIPALVTDRIMKGVVALSEGGWFRPAADGADERGCINVLTSSRPTPLARGNPQHTNLVQARKV